MADLMKWSIPGSWQDLFGSSGSGLNSLANSSTVLSTATIDNSASLEQYMDISLTLGAISPTGTPIVSLFLLELMPNGSDFVSGEAGSTIANQPTGSFVIRRAQLRTKAASITNLLFSRIWIPPNQFKIALLNQAGVAYASSGNDSKYRLYSEDLNG